MSKPLVVRADQQLLDRVDAVARRERRSRSAQCLLWIERALALEGEHAQSQRVAGDVVEPVASAAAG